MNFDEIKKTMDNQEDNLEVPLSIKEISASRSMLSKLKKWLIHEIIALQLAVAIIIYLNIFIPMHQFAEPLLHYTSIMALTAFIGVMAFQIKTALNLKVKQLNSRKTIEEYIIILKSYYQFSLYLATGLAITFYIPIHISSNGNKLINENIARSFLLFEGPAEASKYVFGFMLFFTVFIFFWGKWIYKNCHYKEIKKIEKILDQF